MATIARTPNLFGVSVPRLGPGTTAFLCGAGGTLRERIRTCGPCRHLESGDGLRSRRHLRGRALPAGPRPGHLRRIHRRRPEAPADADGDIWSGATLPGRPRAALTRRSRATRPAPKSTPSAAERRGLRVAGPGRRLAYLGRLALSAGRFVDPLVGRRSTAVSLHRLCRGEQREPLPAGDGLGTVAFRGRAVRIQPGAAGLPVRPRSSSA